MCCVKLNRGQWLKGSRGARAQAQKRAVRPSFRSVELLAGMGGPPQQQCAVGSARPPCKKGARPRRGTRGAAQGCAHAVFPGAVCCNVRQSQEALPYTQVELQRQGRAPPLPRQQLAGTRSRGQPVCGPDPKKEGVGSPKAAFGRRGPSTTAAAHRATGSCAGVGGQAYFNLPLGCSFCFYPGKVRQPDAEHPPPRARRQGVCATPSVKGYVQAAPAAACTAGGRCLGRRQRATV